MPDLKYRQQKIQEKRKKTPWRDFLKEIASWMPLNFHHYNGLITRYPQVGRVGQVVSKQQFAVERDSILEYNIPIGDCFFEQVYSLQKQMMYPALTTYGGEANSDYADITYASNNAYLTINSVWNCENTAYSVCVKENCRNIFNSLMAGDSSENIYSSVAIIRSYNVFYSKYITDSSNIRFSTNLIACQECLFCDGLENQSYCIRNEQYTKDEYFEKKQILLTQKEQFINWFVALGVNGQHVASRHAQGNFTVECEDVEQAYLCYQIKNGRNLFVTGSKEGNHDMYDCFVGGSNISNHFYGACIAGSAEHIYCSESVGVQSSHLYYCSNITTSSYCLGCVGLQNKQFCIFNKQYTKEERHQKVDEIFSAMEKEGTLGQFFPGSMNPFYFNDTVAYLIDDSFTKEEVEKEGYMWRDEVVKVDIPKGVEVVSVDELGKYEGWKEAKSGKLQAASKKGELDAGSLELGAGAKRRIDPEILKKVIRDKEGNVYRIVKMEYDFLMKHGLPLPRLHRLDRLKMNFKI